MEERLVMVVKRRFKEQRRIRVSLCKITTLVFSQVTISPVSDDEDDDDHRAQKQNGIRSQYGCYCTVVDARKGW